MLNFYYAIMKSNLYKNANFDISCFPAALTLDICVFASVLVKGKVSQICTLNVFLIGFHEPC